MYSALKVEELSEKILVEENNSTVLQEERNTILDNVIRRIPNICTREIYIQTQQQLQDPKVVPGSNTYAGAGALREGSKILIIGDSYIGRVKGAKLQNTLDNEISFIRYFSGAKTQDLHHNTITVERKI